MFHYLIHYVDAHETDLYWRCEAEDYEHAVEQLKDHERTVSGDVLFHEMFERTSCQEKRDTT